MTEPGWVAGWQYDRRSTPRGEPRELPRNDCHAAQPGTMTSACGLPLEVVTTSAWPLVLGAHCRVCGEVVDASVHLGIHLGGRSGLADLRRRTRGAASRRCR